MFITPELASILDPDKLRPEPASKILTWFLHETDIFSSIFGRTDPRIGASKAKNCEDVDFEVHKPPNPPKLAKERKK